jgi:hypothetical protein
MKTISISDLDYDEFLAEIREIVRDEIRSKRPELDIEENWMDIGEAIKEGKTNH